MSPTDSSNRVYANLTPILLPALNRRRSWSHLATNGRSDEVILPRRLPTSHEVLEDERQDNGSDSVFDDEEINDKIDNDGGCGDGDYGDDLWPLSSHHPENDQNYAIPSVSTLISHSFLPQICFIILLCLLGFIPATRRHLRKRQISIGPSPKQPPTDTQSQNSNTRFRQSRGSTRHNRVLELRTP